MNVAHVAPLPRLNRSLRSMEARASLPERVLQFGEGNFLRAFADWMLERMNRQNLFAGRAVLVQPIATGMADALNAQDGLYTVVLRGLERGRAVETSEVVSSVSRCLDPYADYEAFLACAQNPELRFVISNTTEAGIATDPADRLDARPAASFPGKVVQLLDARFRQFGADARRGLVFLPCELIENNGDALREACQKTAESFELPAEFLRYMNESCTFANTLVDRIVTGYPREEAGSLCKKLGYDDRLLVTGELFHAWVIEAPDSLHAELPLREAGLNVTWTSDIRPYRERKVRILNGAHTMTALPAFLAGLDTVGECMQDPLFLSFVERGMHQEILPTLELPRDELLDFAAAVVERFKNPFIQHRLLDIALNSVSKYRARILGSVTDYARKEGRLPPRLSFSMAALIAFYRGRELAGDALIGERAGVAYRIKDEARVLEFFRDAWQAIGDRADRQACGKLASLVLARSDLWGADLNAALPGFGETVSEHLHRILTAGTRAALARL